jgi:hypothetical protein
MPDIFIHEKTYNESDRTLYIEAVVDGMVCERQATLIDPPEYGPALCWTRIHIDLEDDFIDTDSFTDEFVLNLLQEKDPHWTLADTSDSDVSFEVE